MLGTSLCRSPGLAGLLSRQLPAPRPSTLLPNSLQDVSQWHGARHPACSCCLHLHPAITPKPTPPQSLAPLCPQTIGRAAARSAALPLPCVVPMGFLLTDPRPPNLHSSRQQRASPVCTPTRRRRLSWYFAHSVHGL